jgi:4,5-dihydroxyphthalate decarboxylase
LSPEHLEGKRVGLRSYSVTTATWARGILAEDHGIDLGKVHWMTLEDPHVAEFKDPPNTTRLPPGKSLSAMLLEGELDAAILAEPPKEGPLHTLIPEPDAAAARWQSRHGAIQINHMLTVKDSVSDSEAEEILSLFRKSRDEAGPSESRPFGLEENRRNLEAAIACVYDQGMIERRFSVDELFR